MTNELARGWNGRREPSAENEAVEPTLEELDELVTGRIFAVDRLVVETPELALVQAVVEAQLLLFEKLLFEVAHLAATHRLRPVDTGRIRAVPHALTRQTRQIDAERAHAFYPRSCVSRHLLGSWREILRLFPGSREGGPCSGIPAGRQIEGKTTGLRRGRRVAEGGIFQ